MKRKLNDQGSALVWVLVICLIFGILGMAIGWVALSMNNRSIKNNNLNQAYFTARSGVDAIYSQLNGYPKDSSKEGSLYEYLNNNLINGTKSVEFKDIFSDIPTMKTCNVSGIMSKGMVKLTAKAGNEVTYKDDEGKDKTKLKDSETVTLWAHRKIGNNGTNWPSKEWASDMPQKTIDNEFVLGLNESLKYPNIDVAVYKVTPKDRELKGVIKIAKDAATEKKAIFIYIENGGQLTIEGLNYMNQNDADKWFEHPENYIFLPTLEKGVKRTSENSNNWLNWNYYYGPDIFIYVEGGGVLNFSKALESPDTTNEPFTAPYPFYVYGASAASNDTSTTSASINNNSGKTIRLYYINDIKKFEEFDYDKDNKSSDPTRLPLSGYKQMGKPSENGLMVDQWEIYKYERDGS